MLNINIHVARKRAKYNRATPMQTFIFIAEFYMSNKLT